MSKSLRGIKYRIYPISLCLKSKQGDVGRVGAFASLKEKGGFYTSCVPLCTL